MRLNTNLKDYQIANMMFGVNKKRECEIVKKLRKSNIIEPLCEGYSLISMPNIDEAG